MGGKLVKINGQIYFNDGNKLHDLSNDEIREMFHFLAADAFDHAKDLEKDEPAMIAGGEPGGDWLYLGFQTFVMPEQEIRLNKEDSIKLVELIEQIFVDPDEHAAALVKSNIEKDLTIEKLKEHIDYLQDRIDGPVSAINYRDFL